MIFSFSKSLMVLLVCLAFIGQGMAYTVMSYHMTSHMTSHEMMDMAEMGGKEHMQHTKQTMLNDSTTESLSSTQDCCSEQCHCFTGGCSSAVVALIKYQASYYGIVDLSPKISSYTHFAQSHQPSSLYRPPILS